MACGTFGGSIDQQAAFINRIAIECDAGEATTRYAQSEFRRKSAFLVSDDSSVVVVTSQLATQDQRSKRLSERCQHTSLPNLEQKFLPMVLTLICSDDAWLSNAESLLRLTRCPLGLYECALQRCACL